MNALKIALATLALGAGSLFVAESANAQWGYRGGYRAYRPAVRSYYAPRARYYAPAYRTRNYGYSPYSYRRYGYSPYGGSGVVIGRGGIGIRF